MTTKSPHCLYCRKPLSSGKYCRGHKSKYIARIKYHKEYYIENKQRMKDLHVLWHHNNREYHNKLNWYWRQGHGRKVWLNCQNRYNQKNPPIQGYINGKRITIRSKTSTKLHLLIKPTVYPHTCKVCSHKWTGRAASPILCPNCNSHYWNRPEDRLQITYRSYQDMVTEYNRTHRIGTKYYAKRKYPDQYSLSDFRS
jgi:hypothetical protein